MRFVSDILSLVFLFAGGLVGGILLVTWFIERDSFLVLHVLKGEIYSDTIVGKLTFGLIVFACLLIGTLGYKGRWQYGALTLLCSLALVVLLSLVADLTYGKSVHRVRVTKHDFGTAYFYDDNIEA